jgi:hypothetical protein
VVRPTQSTLSLCIVIIKHNVCTRVVRAVWESLTRGQRALGGQSAGFIASMIA